VAGPATENPRVRSSIPPLATTFSFLKRNGFPSPPAAHRCARARVSPTNGLPDIGSIARGARHGNGPGGRQSGKLKTWGPWELLGVTIDILAEATTTGKV
jgi:hypothetical protein